MVKKQRAISLLKCSWYYYWIIAVNVLKQQLGKTDREENAIQKAYKNKNEEFLWRAFLKRLKYMPLVILFWMVFFYVTIFRPDSDIFSTIMRIIGFTTLFLILVASPLILLWRGYKYILYQPKEIKVLKHISLLEHLLPKEFYEECLGELSEIISNLRNSGVPSWQISLIVLRLQLSLIFRLQYDRHISRWMNQAKRIFRK